MDNRTVGCVKLAGEKAINGKLRQTEKCIRYWDTLEGKRQEKVNKLYEYIEGGMTLLGTENGEHGEHDERKWNYSN